MTLDIPHPSVPTWFTYCFGYNSGTKLASAMKLDQGIKLENYYRKNAESIEETDAVCGAGGVTLTLPLTLTLTLTLTLIPNRRSISEGGVYCKQERRGVP
jgi:hypothetical protein